MNKTLFAMAACAGTACVLWAEAPKQGIPAGCDPAVMSETYWQTWNADVQARIDADIEANRKADGVFVVPAAEGTVVRIEQIEHDFKFGAHIFNYNQLGKTEYNDAYKASYGPGGIFNSATIAFYWSDYEPLPGKTRACGSYEDSEEYWNSLAPEAALDHPFWRRPAPGPVVEFCKERGIRLHGHILVWGSAKPSWIWDWYCPEEEKARFDNWGLKRFDALAWRQHNGAGGAYKTHWIAVWKRIFADLSEEEIAARAPVFTKRMREIFRDRVKGVAERFGDVVDSWDVVNESSCDWAQYRKSRSGKPVWRSGYGLMPGDYPLHALLDAKEFFPTHAKLNINDYNISADFLDQVTDLQNEGAKIDIVGCQMHIFNTNDCMRLAEGATDVNWVGTPKTIADRLDMMAKTGKPIHVSEITITSPGADTRSRQIQAILTRNIYRAWFSHKSLMGITWWNTVDGGGVKGEPLVSGLFTRDMRKKPAYLALDELINKEWKTRLEVKVLGGGQDGTGLVRFRGFRGKYRLSWVGPDGLTRVRTVSLVGNGGEEPAAAQAEAKRCAKCFVQIPDVVKTPKGTVLRKLTATGPTGAKVITIPENEMFFDLEKALGIDAKQGVDGMKEAPVTLSFEYGAKVRTTMDLYFANDWYGRISVNGAPVTGTLDGPCPTSWGSRPLLLEKGNNVISFETHHGISGLWKVGLAYEVR